VPCAGLQWGGNRLRMGFVLHINAGALAATRPEAAAIIQGAAEAYVVESPNIARLDRSEALGKEHARELRAHGADLDWTKPSPTHSPRPPKPSTNPIRGTGMSNLETIGNRTS
jgi:hypothetical protein